MAGGDDEMNDDAPSAEEPAPGDGTAGGDEAVRVKREPRSTKGVSGRTLAVGAGALALLLAGLVAWGPFSGDGPDTEVLGADTPERTPSTTTTTPLDVTTAPLTGMPVAPEDAVRLLRPALVAKIDGDVMAMPQEGLESADMVTEVRVEGISRYLAAWHSRDVGVVGPVRSARTTDPDLLAAYGRPLFSYSGGNTGVLRDLRRSDWFTDVSHDAVPSAYARSRDRRVPHDLMGNTVALWRRTPEELAVPPAQFTYASPSEDTPPDAAPIAGVAVPVGSDARFLWDDAAGLWRRWAHGRPHTDTSGEPLGFTNLVVLNVSYVPSAADRQSPEAVSVGEGSAFVLSEGTVREGTWSREDRTSAWNLTDATGAPMDLLAGTTWLVLSDRDPLPLDSADVERLLAGF